MIEQLDHKVSTGPSVKPFILTSNKHSMSTSSGQFQHLLNWVFDLLEIDELICTVLQACLLSLSSSVDDDGSKTHGNGQLDGLHTDTTATTGEDSPLTRTKARLFDGRVCSATRAHDRSSNLVWHAVRNE